MIVKGTCPNCGIKIEAEVKNMTPVAAEEMTPVERVIWDDMWKSFDSVFATMNKFFEVRRQRGQ